MTEPDEQDQAIAELRDRLSKLSEASLRITEGLDFNSVLQGVLDAARSLTGARYGVITLHDDAGITGDFLSSGMTADEANRLWTLPDWPKYFEYLGKISGPLRVPDLLRQLDSVGLPELPIPLEVSEKVSFLASPVLHRGERVGSIYLAEKEHGQEFTQEDEETLLMFASQAAMAIANASRHSEERRARADLETLIDISPVGVVVFDALTGVPKSVNREARRIVDILRNPDETPEQLLEVLTFRRADGREVSLREFPIAELLSVSETIRAEEIVLGVPDGRTVTVLLNATPILSDQGAVESVIVTMQDMADVEEMERLRAEFLGMVSHELRTPLTSIRGAATTMLEAPSDLDPAEVRQLLRIIVDQADSMRDLIGDLLDVARIETGSLSVSPEPVEVAVLVDRARSAFLNSGGRNGLDIDLATDLPLVMADRRRIVQVFANLFSNASRRSPESSVIRVRAAQEGVHVAVSVVDEGRGITTERLPHLFRKFSRNEAEDQGGDTGLGLAICKGIVEAHGGRIWAESDGRGLGARFTFTLPLVEDPTSELRRPSAPSRSGVGSGEAVLVVDDDPQTLTYVRNVLSDAGYNPIVSADPKEALVLVGENEAHLVLLDFMLPGFDGIELLGDILSLADIPVVFLSAYGKDHVIAQAFEAGATDYIVKPFSPTELVARVRAALRKQNERHRNEPSEPYALGDLAIDYTERLVTVAGRRVQLTATEYGLLFQLSANAGRVVTHDQLLRRVWRPDKPGDMRALRTHVRRLRRKLGEDGSTPAYIFAEPRVGYRMPHAERQHERGEPPRSAERGPQRPPVQR
ncbi:MAG: response regulator [Chloroflexota bacterium]|nr:response regulator [Chloroflexota bacterium]MDE2885348.1 response regulator [Chloroflexota bacterium]